MRTRRYARAKEQAEQRLFQLLHQGQLIVEHELQDQVGRDMSCGEYTTYMLDMARKEQDEPQRYALRIGPFPLTQAF